MIMACRPGSSNLFKRIEKGHPALSITLSQYTGISLRELKKKSNTRT
jgi:hypothetical protein